MPYCPDCRYEYKPHAKVCSTCGAELIAHLPPRPRTWWERAFAPPRRPRLRIVTVLGGASILWGLSRVVTVLGGANILWGLWRGGSAASFVYMNTGRGNLYGSLGIDAFISSCVVITGVGLLGLQSWSRKAALGLALCLITISLISFIHNARVAMLLMAIPNDAFSWHYSPALPSQCEVIQHCARNLCFGIVGPALVVYYLRRVDIRMAFEHVIPATVEAMPVADEQIAAP